jgi:hypothetical protein
VDAWVALIGAVAGATIAIVGQYAARRSDARERAITLLLEQCAEVVALAEDYRSRVWEERNNLSNDAVASVPTCRGEAQDPLSCSFTSFGPRRPSQSRHCPREDMAVIPF